MRRARAGAGALAAALVVAACGGPVPPAGPGPEPGPAPTPAPEVPAEAPLVYRPVSPALPPIPAADGPLAVRIVHPTPGMARPRVDSAYIYGAVGSGRAAVTINGTPVPVAPNGAFLAFLPMPADGAWTVAARVGDQVAMSTVAYAAPPPAPSGGATPAARANETFATPRGGVVRAVRDTVATGSDAAVGRPSPTGTYRWFLPNRARLRIAERRGGQYRAVLDGGTAAWIDTADVALAEPPAAVAAPSLRDTRLVPAAEWVDVVVPARFAPFLVEADSAALRLTVYGAAPRGSAYAAPADPLVAGLAETAAGDGSTTLAVRLSAPVWGYRTFYAADGALVLRVRRPPRIDPAAPLRGLRVVVDPGHPPAGATGPTGLREAEANLAIALPLAERLRAAGADVVLTRTAGESVELAARVDAAVAADAHLLVSVHNNALGEGVNPFRAHGTSTYYFHPFSAGLARALNREILGVTGLPDLGARQGNLALVRPTWMPSALTESMFMLIPEQEAALRDPAFVRRLAEAHVRGLEAFLRGRAPSARPD